MVGWGLIIHGFLIRITVHGWVRSEKRISLYWYIAVYFGAYKFTKESIALTMTGTEVNARVMIPNKLMLRLDKAAALGSDCSKTAVAMADDEPPSVTPLVT